MLVDIRVPEAGESITQVELAKWLVEDGQYVEKDQEIAEIDSDKASLTINADGSGTLKIIIEEGTTLEPGKIIGQIDTSAAKPETAKTKESSEENKDEKTQDTPAEEKSMQEPAPQKETAKPEAQNDTPKSADSFSFSPQAQRLMDDLNVDVNAITSNPDAKRITRKDILQAIAQATSDNSKNPVQASRQEDISQNWGGGREVKSSKMSTLRKKIAERLVSVKNQTAMLTTFNEVDMSALMNLRNQYKAAFEKKYGIKPGFMSFFAKAVTSAIPYFPQVNGQIQEGNILIPEYADIGIAVSTPKGLMVPVIRSAESKSVFELEKAIAELAQKARDGKISIEDLSGGTFSITNGGVFGSMLSTPIINPPQSAILGMHNIIERPVAINGKVEIRPIMYLALSYDHRIIDGKESVGFLGKVKEMIESPEKMLFGGKNPHEILLGL